MPQCLLGISAISGAPSRTRGAGKDNGTSNRILNQSLLTNFSATNICCKAYLICSKNFLNRKPSEHGKYYYGKENP